MSNTEYPKALYKGSIEECLKDSVTVQDAEAEEAARAEGYKHYAEIYTGEDAPAPAEKAKKAQ